MPSKTNSLHLSDLNILCNWLHNSTVSNPDSQSLLLPSIPLFLSESIYCTPVIMIINNNNDDDDDDDNNKVMFKYQSIYKGRHEMLSIYFRLCTLSFVAIVL